MKIISDWFQRYLNDPQAVILLVLLMVVTAVILLIGNMLTPVIAGIVIAYLLEGLVQLLERQSLPRLPAVLAVFTLFITFVLFLSLGLLPLLSRQLTQLVQQFPTMLVKGQDLLLGLPAMYPQFITETQVLEVIATIKTEIAGIGQKILSWSLASVVGFITIIVYLVLVPLLAFFSSRIKTVFCCGFTVSCLTTTH